MTALTRRHRGCVCTSDHRRCFGCVCMSDHTQCLSCVWVADHGQSFGHVRPLFLRVDYFVSGLRTVSISHPNSNKMPRPRPSSSSNNHAPSNDAKKQRHKAEINKRSKTKHRGPSGVGLSRKTGPNWIVSQLQGHSPEVGPRVLSSCCPPPKRYEPIPRGPRPLPYPCDLMVLSGVRNRSIRIGSDFSGLDSLFFAILLILQVDCTVAFSCDNAAPVRKLMENNAVLRRSTDYQFFDDVKTRNDACAPNVDLYIFSPPCITFSKNGKQEGLHNPLGQLFLFSLRYISIQKPRVVLFEMVAGVQHTCPQMIEMILKELRHIGYCLSMDILDSHDFGLPQRRRRLFIVAVACKAQVAAFPYIFPQCLSIKTPLSKCIKVLPPGKWQPYPKPGTRAFVNVMKHLTGLETSGFNVWQTAVCIDVGSSDYRSRCTTDDSITTITATAGHRHDFWVTTKGGVLDVYDLETCQGIWRGVFELPEGVSFQQYGQMIGNSIAWNVLAAMAPMAFLSSGLCSLSEFEALTRRWQTFASNYPA